MARRGSGSNRKETRSLREVARHEIVRTGRKSPGSLLRAFNLKYPNRPLSEREGPNYEEDNQKVV